MLTEGVFFAVVGLVSFAWALWLWHEPTRLYQGPRWIRRIQARVLTWSAPRVPPKAELSLTERQIRSYAKRMMLVSLLGTVFGLYLLLGMY